jgi:hypothetical protein
MSFLKLAVIGAALAVSTSAMACECRVAHHAVRHHATRQEHHEVRIQRVRYERASESHYGYLDESGGGWGGAYGRSEHASSSWSYHSEGRLCHHLGERLPYGHPRLPLCAGEGEVTLGAGFFQDGGGVGGFPESYGGGGGGGYAVVGGGAGARAFASASASASVSVRFRGGFHGGHGGGHHGGCGCGK